MTLRRGFAPHQRVLAIAGGLMLMLGSVAVTGTAHAGGDSSTLVSLTNSERGNRGLPKYSTSSALTSVAQAWAKQLATSRTLKHNPRLTSQVTGYDYVGENVGYGANAAQIHRALMNSAPHKANILDRNFTQIGVGAARDSKGVLWIAEVFRDPAGSSAPKAKPKPKPKPKAAPKPAAKPKPKAAPKPVAKPKPKPKAAPKPAAKPKPKPVSTPKPQPTATTPPAPTYSEKYQQVTAWAQAASSADPLVTTMAFARAMDMLAP